MTNPDGPAPAGNPAPAAGGGAAPVGAAPVDWTATLPEGVRGVVQLKGWRDPASVVESYTNLEKILGAEKSGRTILLPKDDADADGHKAFREKLGVPADAAGYKLTVPDGVDPAFSQSAASWMHEAGLTPKQAGTLNAKWIDFATKAGEAQALDLQAAGEKQLGELKAEWGPSYAQNEEVARRAAREFGVSEDEAKGIEATLGAGGLLKLFHRIGSKLGEASFVIGDGAPTGGAMSPEAAKARIKQLQGDPEWSNRYIKGGASERSEMEKLHRVAFPA